MVRELIFLSVILFSVYMTEQTYFLQDHFINEINQGAMTWKAGNNFDPETPNESIIRLLGSLEEGIPSFVKSYLYKTHDDVYDNSSDTIPSHFDARSEWKQCSIIGQVRDQGYCGSSWALATSSAFADRLCIATDGKFNQLLSAEELTFCCHLCGFGCLGGFPIMAWQYFKRHGIVTGGDYESEEGCQPYRVPPASFIDIENRTESTGFLDEWMKMNHRCTRMCYGEQEIDFEKDHKYTKDYYYLTYEIIQKDIMTYGPIEATFSVYDDFFSYKSGVYQKSQNASYIGGHSVKLIGWGEENGTPYWLAINSWSEDWGDEGLFKIARGTNECGIDNSTTGGVPII